MNNIFSKLRDFVGFNDPYDYEDEEDGDAAYRNMYHQDHTQTIPEEESRQRRTRERISTDVGIGARMSNVIDMPGSSNSMYEVIVMEPRSFEEMPQAIQALRDRKSVVLNLTMMDPDQAQRAVDFVAGGTYATDGHQERVGESIFLFTPNCVQVTTQSGVVHEVAPPQMHTQRTTTPTPAWAPETTRIAKPS